MDIDLNILLDKLNIEPKNVNMFVTALTHRSYLNEHRNEKIEDNEKLEFLGDAVLELIVTEFLFENYPENDEGDLTSFRAATVRTESLAKASERVGLGEFIRMSKGEEATGGRQRPYILANTFEALLGAIFLDQGRDASEKFLAKYLLPEIKGIISQRLDIDPKSKLQELSQEAFSITPYYELVKESGPDHMKVFAMAVKIGNFIAGEGNGHSKQEAEQNAAKKAVEDWQKILTKLK